MLVENLSTCRSVAQIAALATPTNLALMGLGAFVCYLGYRFMTARLEEQPGVPLQRQHPVALIQWDRTLYYSIDADFSKSRANLVSLVSNTGDPVPKDQRHKTVDNVIPRSFVSKINAFTTWSKETVTVLHINRYNCEQPLGANFLSGFSSLKQVKIVDSNIGSTIAFNDSPLLESIDLSGSNINAIPKLQHCECLQELMLNRCDQIEIDSLEALRRVPYSCYVELHDTVFDWANLLVERARGVRIPKDVSTSQIDTSYSNRRLQKVTSELLQPFFHLTRCKDDSLQVIESTKSARQIRVEKYWTGANYAADRSPFEVKELAQAIFSFIRDRETLKSVNLVCRSWRAAAQYSPIAARTQALATLHRYQVAPASDLSSIESVKVCFKALEISLRVNLQNKAEVASWIFEDINGRGVTRVRKYIEAQPGANLELGLFWRNYLRLARIYYISQKPLQMSHEYPGCALDLRKDHIDELKTRLTWVAALASQANVRRSVLSVFRGIIAQTHRMRHVQEFTWAIESAALTLFSLEVRLANELGENQLAARLVRPIAARNVHEWDVALSDPKLPVMIQIARNLAAANGEYARRLIARAKELVAQGQQVPQNEVNTLLVAQLSRAIYESELEIDPVSANAYWESVPAQLKSILRQQFSRSERLQALLDERQALEQARTAENLGAGDFVERKLDIAGELLQLVGYPTVQMNDIFLQLESI